MEDYSDWVIDDSEPNYDEWEMVGGAFKPMGQSVEEGIRGALPAAGNMLKSVGTGLYDIAGRNIPDEEFSMANELKNLFGFQAAAQKEHGYSPQRAAQKTGSALMQGGRAVLNAPANAIDYLKEGDYIPDYMQAWRPGEDVQNANYDEMAGLEGHRSGDEIFGTASLIPSLVATGFNPYAAIGLNAIGENQNPIEQMLAGRAIQTGAKLAPKIAKPIIQGGKKTINTAINKAIVEPVKSFRESGQLEKSILENKKGKLNAEQQKQIAQESLIKILDEHLNEQPGQARQNAAIALKDAGKELRETSSNMYEDFNNSKPGQKRIFKPIPPEFFAKQYKFPKGALSETTQNMIDKTIGTYSETSVRNPLSGKLEFKATKHATQPQVKDYINLEKHLRDEGASLRRRASAQDMSKGDADILRGQANSLDRLRKDIKDRVNGTLSEKQQTQYQGIQNFHKDYVVPFAENPTLKNASKNTSSIKTNKILESLDKSGHHVLKEALLENQKVAEAIGKHDLRAIKAKNPETLKKAIEGDLGKTLPAELKQGLKKHYETLIDADRTIKALEHKLKEEGLSKAEIDQKISKYKKLGLLTSGTGGTLYALKLLMGIF